MSLLPLLTLLAETTPATPYAYTRPFLQPLPVWDYWPALLFPLLLAVAIVYKAVRGAPLRALPMASVIFVFWVTCAYIGIAAGVSAILHFVV